MKWTKEEIQYLWDNAYILSNKEIGERLGRSERAVQLKTSRYGIAKERGAWIWKEEDIKNLKKFYPIKTKQELTDFFNGRFSAEQIKNKKDELRLVKSPSHRWLRNGRLDNLLKETKEAYYWVGFLYADGCLCSSDKSIRLRIAEKDLNHLKKYAKFTNSNIDKHAGMCGTNIGDSYKIKKFTDKFDFKFRKTYNPPNIEKVLHNKSHGLQMSLFAGFIDGDGSHSKKGYYTISVHKTWLGFLNYFYKYIDEHTTLTSKEPRVYLKNYCRVNINDKILQNIIKPLKIDHLLMERKWFQ